MSSRTKYMFVIDTDSYAGNFEREISAFCTGVASEYGPEDTSETFQDTFPEMYEIFKSKVDCGVKSFGDGECKDPCTLTYTPGYVSYPFIGAYEKDEVPDNALELLSKAANDYYLPLIAQYEANYAKDPAWIHSLTSTKDSLVSALSKGLVDYGANNSVEIHFHEKPTVEEIEFMKQRAYEFPVQTSYKIKIEGFRLETEITTSTFEDI